MKSGVTCEPQYESHTGLQREIIHSWTNTKVAFLQAKKLTRPVDCMTTPVHPNTGESANQSHLP